MSVTLTGYNSEYSDRPFAQKKLLLQGGGKNVKASHLLLNQEIAEASEWNADRILERAGRLAELAVDIWPMVEPSQELLEELENSHSQTTHSVEEHLSGLNPTLLVLMNSLRQGLSELHPQVQEVATKKYIAFKVHTNFCDITPLSEAGTVKCWLNMPFGDLDDPNGLARDVTDIGHHGNGDVQVTVEPDTILENFLELAQQSLNYQLARQQGSSANGDTDGQTIDFSKMPLGAQAALAKLEERCQPLGIQSRDRRYYRSYVNRYGFMELRPRNGGLLISIKLPPAQRLTEHSQEWTVDSRYPNWLNRIFVGADEIDQHWDTIQQAYESQGKNTADSKTTVSDFLTLQTPEVQLIITKILESSKDFQAQRARVNHSQRTFSVDTQAGTTWKPFMEVDPRPDGRVRLYLYTTMEEAVRLGLEKEVKDSQGGFVSLFLISPEEVLHYAPLIHSAYMNKNATSQD